MAGSQFEFPTAVEDEAVYQRTVQLLREHGVRLPTFAEIADPAQAPADVRGRLSSVGPDEAHSDNLYRVNWFNGADRVSQTDIPQFVELPSSLTGVEARIVVAIGAVFPMIATHKVLAAYACLAPRLVSGRFDPTRQRAVWPSTGNYCRGGVAISRILGCRGVAVLPEGMSRERFEWLENWVTEPEDIVRTPGTESNVKEIYDACKALDQDPQNEIVNQFSEFANYLGHWRCTAPALEKIYQRLEKDAPGLRLAGYVSASGSSGTLGAGDYLKDRHGARIAVVEALECPTLLYNGFGEHNIQGIGDKHVPLIHNVMNTDLFIGVSDKATDGLGAVFNTPTGRALLRSRFGLDDRAVESLSLFGFSSIANILGAIKMAKNDGLGPEDVVLTVATDSHALYSSEQAEYLRRHGLGEDLTEAFAAELVGRHLVGADTDHMLDANRSERRRVFNLGYFTWVEQQGVGVADFERRADQAFWRGLHDLPDRWDEMIRRCNRDSGADAA